MDAAHHEARAIEELLADEFDGNASALVHMDPCDPRYCPICAQQTCQWRSQTVDRTVHWNGGHLARSRSDRSNPDD
jgi:hypothetical protein